MKYKIFPLSEDAIIIENVNNQQALSDKIKDIQLLAESIRQHPFVGFKELVPAYHTVTIYYDFKQIKGPSPYLTVKEAIQERLHLAHDQLITNKRYFEVPVCYDPMFGLDLHLIASENNMAVESVISLHTNTIYDVVFIGFAPGFPFLSGLDERIHFPRKTTPRLQVAGGSVGIAGSQTGIYPLTSPGGWQIIGRTPLQLFDVHQKQPTLFKAGDQIKFYPISVTEYVQWEE